MTKMLPISTVKTHLSELVSKIEARDDQWVVTRNGKPAVVILSYDDYEQPQETLDVLSDPAMMRQIHCSIEYFTRGGKIESPAFSGAFVYRNFAKRNS